MLAAFFFLAAAAHGQMVANDDTYGVPYGQDLVADAPGVLANDTFNGNPAEDAGATAELVSWPSYGYLSCEAEPTFELCPDGSFIYTPNVDFPGSDTFTYEAVFGTDTSQATVTLTACNGGPTAFTCWTEASYLAKLGELGYSTFQEGFESDAAWGSVRDPNTALSVVSQGIAWQTNHPDPPASNGITTGDGPARTGMWGVYDPNHGYATGTPEACNIPTPDCLFKDGFTGTRQSGETTLYGVGGYFTGQGQPNLVMILDGGTPVGLGRLFAGGEQFFGVIDTAGLTSFRVEETDGKVGQERYVFGDDFTFGTTPSDTMSPTVTRVDSLQGTGDGQLVDGEVTSAAITKLYVQFSELVQDLGGLDPGDVTNAVNLLLFDDGGNGFDTPDCIGGVATGDNSITVDWVSYLSGSQLEATLFINGGVSLPGGDYRLLVCGSTSIRDWAGNPLDGDGNGTGGDDFRLDFTVFVNHAPVANPDGYVVGLGGTLMVPAPGVLVNDTDVEGDGLTSQLEPATGPNHAASFLFNSDGSFSYTHDGSASLTDSFGYRASDGVLTSAPATVTITVNSGPITWYVATTGDDLDDCLSAVNPCRTVQEAVVRAAGGDTIMVAAGVYAVTSLRVDKNLAIVGAGITTVLDGGGAGLAVGAAPGVVLSFRSLAFADRPGG